MCFSEFVGTNFFYPNEKYQCVQKHYFISYSDILEERICISSSESEIDNPYLLQGDCFKKYKTFEELCADGWDIKELIPNLQQWLERGRMTGMPMEILSVIESNPGNWVKGYEDIEDDEVDVPVRLRHWAMEHGVKLSVLNFLHSHPDFWIMQTLTEEMERQLHFMSLRFPSEIMPIFLKKNPKFPTQKYGYFPMAFGRIC